MNIPFFRQNIGDKEHKKIDDILKNSSLAVETLESSCENFIGASFALATSHGTAALHLAMLAIDLKRGDKIICSVNSFASVPEVVRHFDAEPIFIDVDEWTYNIDIDKLESYLEEHSAKKLKAVIVSYIAGQPIDIERLYNIAKIYNVKIIEDASDAFGATYKGKKIGSLGADITCFSFSPYLKQSVSNGGLLVTNDDELYDRACLLRDHALVRDEDDLDYVYDVVDIGSKYTMSPLEAAYNDAHLSRAQKAIERQKEIAAIYNEKLKAVSHITLPEVHQDHIFSNYIIKIDKNRDSFARSMLKAGIKTGLHYIPLHLMSYYKNKYSLRINDFPVALRNYQQVLSLPIYESLTDKEVSYICKTIIEIASTRV